MSAAKERVIGRPAGRISEKRKTAYKKGVREVLALKKTPARIGNHGSRREISYRCSGVSLAQHLKHFASPCLRRVKAKPSH
jgi:hypothetical protein